MPKNKVHPVEIVRKSTGKSRPHFAALIGCTQHAIKRVENGRLALSRKLANRIYLATGANPDELLKSWKGNAVDLSGLPYTPESWAHWQNRPMRNSTPTRIEDVLGWVEIVLLVAQNKGKLPQVYESLCDWLDATREDFKLTDAINQELKSRAFMQTERRTVAQWRIDPTLARFFGFKDSTKHREDDVIELVKQVAVPWCPNAPPPQFYATSKQT